MATAAERTERSVPLDEVMLAMDVVDTLRHERALVDAALDEEQRARELTERVQRIYASQGIEVPAAVIAEAVDALRQDRFTYEPPARTFAVRLAEIYVQRGKWAKRLAVVALIGAGLWAAYAIPTRLARQASVASFAARLTESRAQVHALRAAADQLAADLELARAKPSGSLAPALLDDASTILAAARTRLAELAAEVDADPDPATYPDHRADYDARVDARRTEFAAIGARLGQVRGRLESVAALGDTARAAQRALARLDGVEVEPAARAELDALAAAIDAAVADGDFRRARASLEQLEALVEALDESYELRIVSREGARSGVWREHSSGGRNHYVIVEAVGSGGRVLPQLITSEEDGTTRRVRSWGIRVPERFYEAVKADKLDNGIIDDAVVGTKRRGARAPEYRIEIAGGAITEW